MLRALLLALTFLGLVLCSEATVSVPGQLVHPEKTTNYVPDLHAKVTLDHGLYSSLVLEDGSFNILNVPEGSYILNVQSRLYDYPTLKIQVDKGGKVQAYSFLPGSSWDTSNPSVELPLRLLPKSKRSYFMAREGFNLMGLLMSPYVLMMGFTGLMVYGVPKLMENMDPEALKEMQKSQKDAQKFTSFLQSAGSPSS
ncbi:MAG: hypothetical protein DHS80DRAFT_32885 [Piptocephalis tieghemiana]|nr:MAG: hypothetical protein DHS80DRAFT_32885 [Piptocephalis tieghemiana]